MEQPFKGFEIEDEKLTGIPDAFFRYALTSIQDIDLLKLILYFLWKANKVGDYSISLNLDELKADEIFIKGLSPSKITDQYLSSLFKEAFKQGFLVCQENAVTNPIYYLNCEDGRKQASNSADNRSNITLDQISPNIFQVYEENIGPLTPIIADALREAEKTYDKKWIMDAIKIAIKQNARSWRYVERILERWQKEGRDGTNRRDNKTNYRRYLEE